MSTFGKACVFSRVVLLVLYIGVCIAALIGTRGLFGFAENTDAVVWLIYLGLPWSLLAAALPEHGLQQVGLIFVVAAPIINLLLVSRICRRRRRRR